MLHARMQRHSRPPVVLDQMDLVEADDAVGEGESGGGASAIEEVSGPGASEVDGDPGLDASDGQPAEAEDRESDEGDVNALPSLHGSALAVASEEEQDQEQSAQSDRHARDDDGKRLGARLMQPGITLAALLHVLVADQTQHHAREDEKDPFQDSGDRETVSRVH